MAKIVAGVFIIALSLSAWQKNGLPITSEPGIQTNPRLIVPQGKDYFYVVWEDYNKFPSRVTVGKFDATTGQPLWPSPFLVADSGGNQRNPQAVSTPSGGLIIAFQIVLASKRTIFATKIGPDKTWQWSAKWVQVSSVEDTTYNPLLCLDDSGEGCYVTWVKWDEGLGIQDIQAAHISSQGEVSFRKTLTSYTSGGWFPAIVPSLSGDAIVLWQGKRPGDDSSSIFGQRLSPTGELKWDTLGLLINRLNKNGMWLGAISNNKGGAIVLFQTWVSTLKASGTLWDAWLAAQNVSPEGNNLWQPSGVKVNSGREPTNAKFDTDGYSGCILSYKCYDINSAQQLMASRCDSAGNLVWSAQIWTPDFWKGNWYGHTSIVNSAPGEGIITWDTDSDSASGDIFAARVDVSGNVHWTVPICALHIQFYNDSLLVIPDTKGGAYIVWEDERNGWNNVDIFAQHIDSTGAMGIGETAGRKQTLDEGLISIEPNPFSKTTKISSENRAASSEGIKLNIYDVAGKLVKSFSLAPHPSLLTTGILWDGRADTGKPTPPGVYFCRLDTKNYQTTKKLIRLK